MTSPVPATPLDPSAAISEALKLYRDQVAVLLPLALGLFAIQAVVLLAMGPSTSSAAAAASVVGLILGSLFQGMVIQVTRDAQDGTLDSSIGQLLSSVAPVLPAVIIVAILNGIAVGIGFLLLIVPGVVLLTIWFVVIPVTVLEQPGIIAAFGRSRELVRGSGWQVFGVILFVLALSIAASLIAGVISASFSDAGEAIVSWLLNAAIAPVTALIAAVVYLRLRDVKGEPPLDTGAAVGPGPSSGLPSAGGPSGIPRG